jgi:rubrerythrin
MDDSMKKVAEVLKKAIQAEIEGQHFYRMAARSTDDPRGREVFERLAQDEVAHEKFLRAHLRSILETGRPDADAKLGRPTDFSGSSPIFSEALRSRIGEAHYEMTALSVGIQLELAAEKFYRRASEETADPQLEQQLRELADWEAGHYRALLVQQEELKEDYWAASGFSPF